MLLFFRPRFPKSILTFTLRLTEFSQLAFFCHQKRGNSGSFPPDVFPINAAVVSPGRLLSNRQMWILTAAPSASPWISRTKPTSTNHHVYRKHISRDRSTCGNSCFMFVYFGPDVSVWVQIRCKPPPPPKKSVTTFINIYFYLLTEFVLVRLCLTRFSPDVSSDRRPILSPNLLKFTHLFCGNSCFLFVSN